ncbi:MAG: hypothetical protein N2D54_07805, partial [Chloroflexota bacterium]
PEGLLFGRQFDLAQFSWQLVSEPACHLFLGNAVPGEDAESFPYKWGGWNLTGWRNELFFGACNAAREAIPGQDNYTAAHLVAQDVFANDLPAIPLFTYQSVIVARPDLCGLANDATAGGLWNIERLYYADTCN